MPRSRTPSGPPSQQQTHASASRYKQRPSVLLIFLSAGVIVSLIWVLLLSLSTTHPTTQSASKPHIKLPQDLPLNTNNSTEKMVSPCQHKHSAQCKHEDRDVLPGNVKPQHYDLMIVPTEKVFSDPAGVQDFGFAGQVSILIKFEEESDYVALNASELDIVSVELVVDDKKVPIEDFNVDTTAEVLKVQLAQSVPSGRLGRLSITYTGTMNDKMAGFYRSSYKHEGSGSPKYMVATQFEATDARRAFPCWDEPSLKATFSISIEVPQGITALSNMDLKATTNSQTNTKLFAFKKTPAMSTYLVAWVIGELSDFGKVSKTEHGDVEVRVWAAEGTAAVNGDFAREVAAKTLDFFSEYFGQPYPLPKMDMVAIPDFAAGAMENWGLVTYRTVYLLFDPSASSLKTKQQVAYVVGHELAHQWFGNLVTMEWWSDLWLNEGFATWVGWLAADKLFPEWDIWTEFVIDDCQAGLSLDSLRSSHPIEVPVKNPSEISQIFDSISYSKGASIIRMLVTWLGENVFKRGIREYLSTFKYGNARTEDLWNSLAKASGKSVNEMMGGWTKVMGYPVVNAGFTADNELHVRQSRFLASGDAKPEEDAFIWSIPLFPSKDDHALLLDSREKHLSNMGDLVKLNVGQAGFYRVNYSQDWLSKLGKIIEQDNLRLSASDRIGIISDVHSLSVSGTSDLVTFLDLAVKFGAEQDYMVWNELLSRVQSIVSLFWQDPQTYASLERLVNSLVCRKAQELGFDFKASDDDKTKLLRQLIIGAAGRAGNPNVIKEAQERFVRFMGGDHSAIHPNLRGTVYAIVARNGGTEEFEAILKLYAETAVPDQKLSALGALGSSRDPVLLKRALQLTKDPVLVRPQDVIYIFRSVGANRAGREECWSFVRENWHFFHERYQKGGFSLLSRIVTSCTDGFTRAKDADDVELFFKARGDQSKNISRALEQSLERIRTNAKWLDRNKEQVGKWLAEKLPVLLKL